MEELPISIISIIGKILDIGSDFRTLRLINKNWASELGTSLTYLNFNFSDNKIDIIKNIHENYFFDWFINHIQRFYPCVYHINITFTITDNNISEDCFLYFFDTLIKWCMKTKKNKMFQFLIVHSLLRHIIKLSHLKKHYVGKFFIEG